MYTNIVLSGGALKGTSFIGCLKYMEEQDCVKDFKNVLGSSSGSIMALFLVLGYTSCEIEIFLKKELSNLFDIKISNMLRFFKQYGLDDGTNIETFLEKILEYKNISKNVTFMDLSKKTGKNLIVACANLSKSKLMYFNVDNNSEMLIKKAIRMSTSIPFLFKPMLYDEQYCIDAFIYNNFPIEYFENEIQYTIGIKINAQPRNITTFFDFISKIFSTMIDKLTNTKLDYKIIEINLNSYGCDYSVKSLKFDVRYENMSHYVNEGYVQLKEQFDSSL